MFLTTLFLSLSVIRLHQTFVDHQLRDGSMLRDAETATPPSRAGAWRAGLQITEGPEPQAGEFHAHPGAKLVSLQVFKQVRDTIKLRFEVCALGRVGT